MLIKVCVTPKQRSDINNLVQIFHGDIVDISATTVTVAIYGRDKKLAAFQDLCCPYGVLEVARTGRVALIRESGVDTRYWRAFNKEIFYNIELSYYPLKFHMAQSQQI